MRMLLFHCKEYRIIITELSKRPVSLIPEDVKEKEQQCLNCVTAFMTVEDHDTADVVEKCVQEIVKMCRDIGNNSVMLVPFAHLSNQLASSEKSLEVFSMIEKQAMSLALQVKRAHFGSHKELLLHVYGHPGNVRYREF